MIAGENGGRNDLAGFEAKSASRKGEHDNHSKILAGRNAASHGKCREKSKPHPEAMILVSFRKTLRGKMRNLSFRDTTIPPARAGKNYYFLKVKFRKNRLEVLRKAVKILPLMVVAEKVPEKPELSGDWPAHDFGMIILHSAIGAENRGVWA